MGRPLNYQGIPARVVFSGEMMVLALSVGSVLCDFHLRQG